jgi:hypothetical protein
MVTEMSFFLIQVGWYDEMAKFAELVSLRSPEDVPLIVLSLSSD